MAFIAIPDTRLRLTLRARQPPWFTTLPVVLMVGFLALITAATLLLRRQINQVARAESAWRTEAAWRQSLEESALVGLRARDLDGHLLFANRTFCDMVGYSLEELIAQGPASNTPVPNQSGIAVQRAKREGFETAGATVMGISSMSWCSSHPWWMGWGNRSAGWLRLWM